MDLKILIVSHYYAAHGGGIERVIAALLRHFLVYPHLRFTWAATDENPTTSDPPNTTALPMAGWNGLEQRFGLPLPLWSLRALLQLIRVVRAHDVVWLHDTLYHGNIVAAIAARIMGRPLVITQHIGAVPYRQKILRAAMRLACAAISAPLLRLATRAVFISDHVHDSFRGSLGRQAPHLIPNGVDHAVFHPPSAATRQALRAQLGLQDTRPALLFVGRFVEKKGLAVLRALAARMPEVDWIFAGQGPLDPAAWNLPQLRVMRGRSGATLAELYQATDLLLLPSVGEGFPLVLQEAAACALPAFCAPESAAGSASAAAFFITAPVALDQIETTTSIWHARLTALLSDRAALRERGQALAALAAREWRWDRAAAAYAALFAEVADARATLA